MFVKMACGLLLPALIALVAGSCVPATATAQETEVEVINEPTGDPCDPCSIHLEGESHITALPAGVIVSSCHDEYSGNIYHHGSAEVEWVGVQHGAATCALVNCQFGEGHWPITALGELGTGEEHSRLRFCLRNPGTGAELHCDWELHIDGEVDDPVDPGAHHYFFSTEQLCAAGTRRFEGLWELENDGTQDDVELVHHV